MERLSRGSPGLSSQESRRADTQEPERGFCSTPPRLPPKCHSGTYLPLSFICTLRIRIGLNKVIQVKALGQCQVLHEWPWHSVPKPHSKTNGLCKRGLWLCSCPFSLRKAARPRSLCLSLLPLSYRSLGLFWSQSCLPIWWTVHYQGTY